MSGKEYFIYAHFGLLVTTYLRAKVVEVMTVKYFNIAYPTPGEGKNLMMC